MPNFSGVWNLKEQIQAIAAGRWTGVSTFALYTWGDGRQGQLGDGTVQITSSPAQVGSLTNWALTAGGYNHLIATKTDGTLWAWGDNPSGQLGDSTVVAKSSPVQIGALTTWSQVSGQIAGGGFHTLAMQADGTLWAWGRNDAFLGGGQLGDGTTVSKSSPVQVGALTNWSQVAAGAFHTAAVKTDGTLWTWGDNIVGQLGDGTAVAKSSPVQIGALTTWYQVSAGDQHTAAIKTDGTLWTWGRNDQGELGDGTVINKSSPVQVGALSNWAFVACAGDSTAAIKTDGTLWTWGEGLAGVLGLGDVVDRSSPTQVGALTNWSKVSPGSGIGFFMAAIKTDGTLWAWGLNNQGALGDGTAVSRSSPVQVGALTTWYNVACTDQSMAAILQNTTN